MAYIRTIKATFFTSDDIVSLSPLARLLYIALWTEADREGRMYWRPGNFKLRFLPGDNCDINALCEELLESGLVVKHTACPVCGGRDRFRFDDRDGRGTFYCSRCGAGDGFKLLGLLKGWPFREAAKEIEAVVGIIPVTAPVAKPNDADKLAICRRIWGESLPVVPGDPASLYLERRCGIDSVSPVIRHHPRLAYRHDDGHVSYHPAMVCRVQDVTGAGSAIHRTYLTDDGQKADVPTVKKVAGNLPAGAAIHLFTALECIGIAEGIETALSAFLLFGIPTWAAVTAGGLERWAPPTGTKRVIIFGDNDISGTGQAAAWVLAKRLIGSGVETEVRIPSQDGCDWNDIHMDTK